MAVQSRYSRVHCLRRSLWQHKLKAGSVVGVLITAFLLLEPPAIADLSEENRQYTADLLEDWRAGEVVVLLRHLERCDRYDLPCLTDKEGITSRAIEPGRALQEDFSQLGLGNTDIFNSPMLRTAETEAIVFADQGEDRDWLINCHDNLLGDVMANKRPGRNLALVTHSRCIKRFNEALGYADESPGYGAALFFSTADDPKSLQVLGFLDQEDWEMALGF
ncbi:MAG: histidine phosphatase family protein [Gammaproteobacteria bacterium]|nr:histidine phosphatase family protein [Gammaproteobacteria bacterium]